MANTAALSLSASRSFGLSWPAVLGAAAFALTLLLGERDLADPDIYFHVVTGRWMLAHGAVPYADIFSFSLAGAPWVAHEWLAEVAMALAYDALGWSGLVIGAGLAVAAAVAIFTRGLLRNLAPQHALPAVAVAMLLLLPHLVARPHLLALPLLVYWVAELIAARDRGEAPRLALAFVMLAWSNLHGSFLFGLAFGCLMAGEAVLLARDFRQRCRAARDWAGFLALAAVLALVSPNGLEVYLLPLRLLDMHYALGMLAEWQNPKLGGFEPLEVWLLLALLLGFRLRLRLPVTRLAILLLLVHTALAHWRHGEILGFTAPLLVAAALRSHLRERAATAGAPGGPRWMMRWAAPAGPGGILAMLGVMAVVALALADPALAPPTLYRPAGALAAVRSAGIDGPVLNDYNFGGYLIFAGVPTFVDGRADMYGDDFLRRNGDAVDLHDDSLPALLQQYRIRWTLFPPRSPTVVLLDHLAGWRRLYADETAVVHVRAE